MFLALPSRKSLVLSLLAAVCRDPPVGVILKASFVGEQLLCPSVAVGLMPAFALLPVLPSGLTLPAVVVP